MFSFFLPPFSPLLRELSHWQKAGMKAVFWFRDDDASEMTAKIEPLLAFQEKYAVPLALAVIPKHAGPCLPHAISKHPNITVIQHGWDHENRSDSDEAFSEFPASQPTAEVSDTIANGRAVLEKLYGDQFFPAFVPPWNHIAAEHLPALQNYAFLSNHKKSNVSGCAIPIVPVHIDVLRWRGRPRFRGMHRIIREICEELQSQRLSGKHIPIGIQLHHLVMDAQNWAFLDKLVRLLAQHPSIHFPSIRDLGK